MPALKRHRQTDLHELEASLFYRGSFRTAKATQGNPVSKKPNQNQNQIKQMQPETFLYAIQLDGYGFIHLLILFS